MTATVAEIRAALDDLPQKHRAWLESGDIELFAYYGWGVVLTSAQVEHLRDVLTWPPGTIHVWRWANRTGKTTGLDILYLWAAWYKWRYTSDDFEHGWLPYLYKILHAAPLSELAGKAWGLCDELIAGRAYQQRNPITKLQRPALLAPFFSAQKLVDANDVDRPVVLCANNSQIDFRSTQGKAARLESDSWWLIGWDEFPRQQPAEEIYTIFDQTMLPRSSDFLSPIVLAGTATIDSEWVYAELEDIAAEAPSDWNFTQAARHSNFSQSKASIDRQQRVSINKDVAKRSLEGTLGGNANAMYPEFLLKRAFDSSLPETITPPKADDERGWAMLARTRTFVTGFDHALAHDDNVFLTLDVPWPPHTISPSNPIIGAHIELLRSSRTLTGDEQQAYLSREVRAYRSRAAIIDSTGEGGLSVFRKARQEGLPVVDCNLQGRAAKWVTNKEYGLQALQRMLSKGLPVEADGFIDDWPEVDPATEFGILRFPTTGPWMKLRRQLAVYKRQDEKLRQDAAMTLVMLAWYLWKLVGHAGDPKAQPFNIMASRPTRGRRFVAGRR